MEEYDEEEAVGGTAEHQPKMMKKGNVLPLWGNERTMNMNSLILTNIQSSHYFKVNLYELKTYHEVIDEIYYKVQHLEPWEKGSRKTAGQTGMCGGVRGVGAGGIVSTAYCLLYKLFTLRLTRKQLNGLINHQDSPYLRALGFMYIRYTQPPADLYDWYDEYLEDEEELDVKAGGGQVMTIGDMLRAFLTKLEWFSTLFPRIPVPIQQKNDRLINERFPPPPKPPIQQIQQLQQQQQQRMGGPQQRDNRNNFDQDSDRYSRSSNRGTDRTFDRGGGGNFRGGNNRGYDHGNNSNTTRERERDRSPVRSRERDRDRHRDDSDRDRDRYRDDPAREKDRHRADSRRDHRDSQRDRGVRGDRSSHRDRDRPRSHYHR